VIAAAWALPPEDRVSGGRGKVVLRTMLERHLPPRIIDRPKQGFAVPLDRWLREGLRDWAEGLLTRPDLLDRAGLDAHAIDRTWASHLARRSNQGQKLWTVLMLLAWLDHEATAERPA
jgi:asparagine synthase (glutamine-hydrolysing)